MKVFISWSGNVSQRVALLLKDWLQNVIQVLDPFVSSENIQKGARWFAEIGKELETTNFGIVCLTPDKLDAHWLLFETGALSNRLGQSQVTPLLIGLKDVDVKPPLSQFQMTQPIENDINKLVHTINAQLPDAQKLSDEKLKQAFDKWWPDFKLKLEEILKSAKPAVAAERRSERDVLEEVLNATRGVMQEIQSLRQERPLLGGHGTNRAFGKRETMMNNCIYQAGTDGYVEALPDSHSNKLEGYADESILPTKVVQSSSGGIGAPPSSISFRVRAGERWKVVGASTVYWTPINYRAL